MSGATVIFVKQSGLVYLVCRVGVVLDPSCNESAQEGHDTEKNQDERLPTSPHTDIRLDGSAMISPF